MAKIYKIIQCYNYRKLKTRIIFVNLTALRALLISAYDVDYTHHKIIQVPKLSLCHIKYDDIFCSKKWLKKKRGRHSIVTYI